MNSMSSAMDRASSLFAQTTDAAAAGVGLHHAARYRNFISPYEQELRDASGTRDVKTLRTYTPDGLLETVTDDNGHVTRYDYDGQGCP